MPPRRNHTLACDSRKERAMSTGELGQGSKSAAEVYEEFFVPALFQEWAPRVADAAALRSSQGVLDVACGTGPRTPAVAERVGPSGAVFALDVNDGMLAVARRRAPQLEWRQGRAEALPIEPRSFDAVVSQFGLMFFEDRAAALGEMMRVLRPGGRLAVAVWDSLERSPGYAAVVALLQRLFGSRAADALRAPFVLGDQAALLEPISAAGIPDAKVATVRGTARFPSIQEWMYTDVRGWTLDEMIDDRQFASLVAEAEKELRLFVRPDGSVAFDMLAHIVTPTKHRLQTARCRASSPLQRVGHPPLVPARIAEVVEERSRHLRVRWEPVFDEDPHSCVNLVRRVADLEIGFARDRLGHMRAGRCRAPGVELPQRLPRGPSCAIEVVHELHDVVLDAMEPPDRDHDLHAGLRVEHRLFVDGLAAADDVRAQERYGPLERARERGPSPLSFTQERAGRHLHVVEAHLALPREEARKPARGYAARLRVDVQEAHVRRPVARADRDDQVGRRRRVAHEELGAVENVAPVAALRRQRDAPRSPRRVRLGDRH